MNTHTEYRRHSSPQPEPHAEAEAGELARHRDPSLSAATGAPSAQRHIAWVRPTELASYAEAMVGRGIDLHAELLRRTRRAPITTTRAIRHPAPTTPPPATARMEGLQL
ncbi:hypothetical protein GCM10028772_13450 [Nocardioides ultimimeridianus]